MSAIGHEQDSPLLDLVADVRASTPTDAAKLVVPDVAEEIARIRQARTRLHHSIGLGHESEGQGTLGGHNFGVLMPVWDLLFGTANFEHRYDPTGIRDQLPEAGGRDYGRGFWQQQWLGLLRLVGKE